MNKLAIPPTLRARIRKIDAKIADLEKEKERCIQRLLRYFAKWWTGSSIW